MPRTKSAPAGLAVDDLAALLPDWRTHLRARNLAPATIASYLISGTTLLDYLAAHGMPTAVSAITRDHLEAWLADLTDRVGPSTVAGHYRSPQQPWRWLVEDGEISHSPMQPMAQPAGRDPPL